MGRSVAKMDKGIRQNSDLAERSAEAAAELADQAAALHAHIEALGGHHTLHGVPASARRNVAPVTAQVPPRTVQQTQHRRVAAGGRMGI